jgi:hypothetical protein
VILPRFGGGGGGGARAPADAIFIVTVGDFVEVTGYLETTRLKDGRPFEQLTVERFQRLRRDPKYRARTVS